MKRTAACLALVVILAVDLAFRIHLRRQSLDLMVVNPGFFGGWSSTASPSVRFGFHIGYYFGICVLVWHFHRPLWRSAWPYFYGVAFFMAGLSGNFFDRLYFGSVVDYFFLRSLPIAVNICDLLQLLGVASVFFGILRTIFKQEGRRDRRGRFFADWRLQLAVFFQVSLIFALFLAAIATFSRVAYGVPPTFIWFLLSYGFLFEVLLFCIVLSATQRIIGPVRAFLRFMLVGDRKRDFKLRDTDAFRDLEKVAGKNLDDPE